MTPHDIKKLDAVLTEDGRAVVIYGYTRKVDRTYVACIDLKNPIKAIDFDPDPALWQPKAKTWSLYA